jgi:hypothetical protein
MLMLDCNFFIIRDLRRSDVANRSDSVPQRNDERRIPNMSGVPLSTFEDQIPPIFPRDAPNRPEVRVTFCVPGISYFIRCRK